MCLATRYVHMCILYVSSLSLYIYIYLSLSLYIYIYIYPRAARRVRPACLQSVPSEMVARTPLIRPQTAATHSAATNSIQESRRARIGES